jgi:hypothetical protein
MMVRILSCGVHWWGMHSKNIKEPYCFRRKPAYFNTTGLMYGRRLRNCQIYPGMLRFNRTSGFDPEFVDRISGKTFQAAPPRLHDNKVHLLFEFPGTGQTPDLYQRIKGYPSAASDQRFSGHHAAAVALHAADSEYRNKPGQCLLADSTP